MLSKHSYTQIVVMKDCRMLLPVWKLPCISCVLYWWQCNISILSKWNKEIRGLRDHPTALLLYTVFTHLEKLTLNETNPLSCRSEIQQTFHWINVKMSMGKSSGWCKERSLFLLLQLPLKAHEGKSFVLVKRMDSLAWMENNNSVEQVNNLAKGSPLRKAGPP